MESTLLKRSKKGLKILSGKMNNNTKDIQEIRNKVLRLTNRFNGFAGESSHPILRYNCHNSIEHEILKLKVCYKLKKKGFHVLTEVEFAPPYSGKCDILCLDESTIYEIIVSETEEMFKEKIKNYPPLAIIKISDMEEFD